MRSGLVADENEIKWNKNNKKSFYMFYISVYLLMLCDVLLLLFRPAVGISGDRAKCNAPTTQPTTYISFYFVLYFMKDGPCSRSYYSGCDADG